MTDAIRKPFPKPLKGTESPDASSSPFPFPPGFRLRNKQPHRASNTANMRDPFPFPPIPALSRAVEPLADLLSMPTLPLHIHEVVGAALFYTFIQVVVSPVLSARLFPKFYPADNRAKKANWDTHVVSLFQALVINVLALWVMFADDERNAMDQEQRVWGYTGACGLIQALAAGYFVWDLGITILNFDIFGIGLLAHAVSALTVYTFGFVRPPSPQPTHHRLN